VPYKLLNFTRTSRLVSWLLAWAIHGTCHEQVYPGRTLSGGSDQSRPPDNLTRIPSKNTYHKFAGGYGCSAFHGFSKTSDSSLSLSMKPRIIQYRRPSTSTEY
jgi:hypothetical protein